jgi:hypothetical protein
VGEVGVALGFRVARVQGSGFRLGWRGLFGGACSARGRGDAVWFGMALKVSVKGERELGRRIKNVRKRLGLSSQEFADEAARSVRDGMIRRVQPFGTGKKEREMGEKAIAGDLWKVFFVVPNRSKGKGVVRSVSDARRIHAARRGSSGRTRRGEKHAILGRVFAAYFEELKGRVGMAKGSVAGGGEARLKGRIPLWVRAHEGVGDAERRRKVMGAVWTFRADPGHVASGRVLGKRGVDDVMKRRKKVLLRRLERKERALLKKAQRKVNG